MSECTCSWNPDSHADDCPVRMMEQINALSQQLEQAEARVAELEAAQEFAKGTLLCPKWAKAQVLRKQAEAVESWVNGFGNRDRAGLTEYAGGFCDGFKSATQSISAYAQHLHKKADEAEKENAHA